jgi:hypothetical protein
MSIHGHQKRDGCEVCKCYDPCSATEKLVHPYIIEDLLILEDPERVSFIVIFPTEMAENFKKFDGS